MLWAGKKFTYTDFEEYNNLVTILALLSLQKNYTSADFEGQYYDIFSIILVTKVTNESNNPWILKQSLVYLSRLDNKREKVRPDWVDFPNVQFCTKWAALISKNVQL